jgi:hypothetical protein
MVKPSAMSIRAAKTGQIVVVPAAAVSYDGHTLITSSDQPQIAASHTAAALRKKLEQFPLGIDWSLGRSR